MENARLTHFPQPSINLLISYHWFFVIIICTVIKVLIKTTVYSLFT
jgi:hypothetical protein